MAGALTLANSPWTMVWTRCLTGLVAAALLGGAVTALVLPLAWRAVTWAASAAERAHGQAGHPLA